MARRRDTARLCRDVRSMIVDIYRAIKVGLRVRRAKKAIKALRMNERSARGWTRFQFFSRIPVSHVRSFLCLSICPRDTCSDTPRVEIVDPFVFLEFRSVSFSI